MVTHLFDLLDHQLRNYPKSDAFCGKVNGEWKPYSIQRTMEMANLVSTGLIQAGIGKDDKVATISNNRPEWNFVDFGILQVGAVHVPIYPTISEREYKFILSDAEVKIVFVSDETLFHKIMAVKNEVASLTKIISFDKIEGCKWFQDWISENEPMINRDQLQSIKNSINPDDVATIIYTSGTTGNPKGVVLTHHNIISNFVACEDLPPVDHNHRALSFLPLCHIYERMLTYLYIYLGVSIYYAESMDKIGDNIREIKPHVFSAVPRLIEKVYDKIIAKGKELSGAKRALFFWAVNLAMQFDVNKQDNLVYNFKLNIARKLIFTKWREALGGNVKVIVSGGAPLQVRLIRIFWAAGIPILEGYGLTETSPVISVNFLDHGMTKFGTVGTVIKNVDVQIAADGEILVKGPSIMKGYYKRPDLTSEVIDADGWFHTGDIGTMEGNFLKITDRKKEIFKTSGGKYIAPQPIENRIKESPFIENIMVIGASRKHAAALVVPAFNYLKEWCRVKNIAIDANAPNSELIKNQDIKQRIWQEVEKFNSQLGQTEQIKKIELVDHDWTVDSGELTPTLKLKRKIIELNNESLIESIYSES